MSSLPSTARRIARLEVRLGPEASAVADRSPWDWYADACPCGRAPGECREHPRARANQRPPAGDWRTWLLLMGRGAGKTRSAAEWVRHQVETGAHRWIALVGPTAADVRDYMVGGHSGILAISPPWFRPRYEPSKRRLTWPNGATATTFSAEEPDHLRGPQHSAAWVDELAAWRYPQALENLLLGLRVGTDTRLCVTTTPRPVGLVTDLIADPTTAIARGTTYENRANLAPSFFERITTKFEGTRLGQQELHGEGPRGGRRRLVPPLRPGQAHRRRGRVSPTVPRPPRHRLRRLKTRRRRLAPIRGDRRAQAQGHRLRRVARRGPLLRGRRPGDPIARRGPALPGAARLGPTGPRGQRTHRHRTGRLRRIRARLRRPGTSPTGPGTASPTASISSRSCSTRGCSLIHPRCTKLKAAFQNYRRKRTSRGDWLDEPEDPQHPHEDLIDALRGGVRDRFPEGRVEQPAIRMIKAGWIV